MFWVVIILIEIALTVVTALLAKKPGQPQPGVLGDFQIPTASEGRAIPYVAGTVLISGPNVTWYGDLQVIKLKGGGGVWAFGKTGLKGFKYFLGMQLVLCHGPVDEWIQMTAVDGSKGVGMPMNEVMLFDDDGRERFINHYFNAPNLYGGETGSGGFIGVVRFYRGLPDATPDGYLNQVMPTASGIDPTTVPAYQNLCYVVLQHPYLGLSTTLPSLGFVVRRSPDPFAQGTLKSNILGGANPAYLIFDIMTKPVLGLGIPSSRFDQQSFIDAGDTLYAESMGISMTIDTAAAADSILSTILRHIDGVLYTDPQTALWTLKLARADYDVDTLPEFDEDDVVDVVSLTRGSWEDTLNEIKVSYIDAKTFKEAIVTATETANLTVRGGTLASQTIEYHGFNNAFIAQRVAMRDLRGFSYPFLKGTITVNRKGWNLRMASVFKLTHPSAGFQMVMRVVGIDYGNPEDSRIKLDVSEDIFGVEFSAYDPPDDSTWTNPNGPPVPVLAQKLIEAPYFFSKEDRNVLALVVRADGTSTDYQSWQQATDGSYLQGPTNEAFTPSALLRAAYSETADSMTLVFPVDIAEVLVSTDAAGLALGKNVLQIDDELIGWTTFVDNLDGTYTISGVLRGALDTLPASHAAGARVYFVSDGSGLTSDAPYPADQLVREKFLPENAVGILDIASATAVDITTASRALRPMPPGNVVVTMTSGVGDLTISYARRSRFTPGLVFQSAPDVADAGEGTVTVEVLIAGAVIHTTTGLPLGGTLLYTLAQRVIDDPDPTKPVSFRITPVAALTGTPRTTAPVVMTASLAGFGSAFGKFGG